jgi:flagellar export protein FliJ
MAAYKFRLQTLLDYRIGVRNQRRVEVAEAMKARDQVAAEQAEIRAELEQLQVNQRSLTSGGPLEVARLVELEQYGQSLRAREQSLGCEIARWSAELDSRQAILCEADREVKLLEKFDERLRDEHRQHVERDEAKQIGEQSRPGNSLKLRVST